jgi:hypothetical protein
MSTSNIANLQRELTSYILEGNDFMVEKIQDMIDKEFTRRNDQNLNEVVNATPNKNSTSINELQ